MIATVDSMAGKREKTAKMVGSVLVVGGGIAGMQAALDCANAGFKVFLLEQQPCIGGNMARLDKTFPTNDCAMCMISPKLVEVGRHQNVEIISYADLRKVDGAPGNFSVEIEKRARFVDEETCNGCGDCEQACPVNVTSPFDGGLSKRKAIYRLYPHAIPNVYAIRKNGVSPCRIACPAGTNAHGYVALIAQGKDKEALELIYETNPFPGSCGMVCAHPCEDECYRGRIDEPIAICALKRFVFESVKDESLPPAEVIYPQRIAVIGAGPAGLTCAYHLQKMGYQNTVFEAFPFAGGMLRMAIPDFRLPREVVDRDIRYIQNTGVKISLNTRVGRDVTFEWLKNEYSAIFVASGAPKPRTLDVSGFPDESVGGAMYGIDFLKDVKLGNRVEIGSRVAVIGGGNTALDAARSAKRFGAEKVTVIYRRSEEEMPAIPEEVDLTRKDGVEIMYLTSPKKIAVSERRVRAMECIKMQLGEKDESGRKKPVPLRGSEFTLSVDTVISAIGQYSDLSFLPEEIRRTEDGNIAINPDTLATSSPGVFAGGDVAAGPDVLIKAIAAGRKAAISIDRYLKGEKLASVNLTPPGKKAEFEDTKISRRKRFLLFGESVVDNKQRLEETAQKEAERCLNCGVCSECSECVKVCEPNAIDHDMRDKLREIRAGAIILASGYDVFDAKRKSEYGFGRYTNVVNSMQFERILSASGPFQGHLQRPSDGNVPTRIAWIQCVGSRDVTLGNDYCSSVCCMYATKEAIMAQEHERTVKPTIFFTDMRAFGKGFESFYNRAKENHGVRFVRSQVSSLKENAQNSNIVVRYADTGEDRGIIEEEFDLVVLSVGLVAGHSARESAETAGVECGRFGFVRSRPCELSKTTRDGVFLAGTAGGPKDIPDTVMQSSAAAALCGEFLGSVRGSEIKKKELPPEKDVAGVEPRIGIFICHCGTNIASVVDVETVCEYAKLLGGVVHAQNTLYTCSQDTQELIKEIIEEKDLNRVIVASCTPRTHEPLFRQTLREAGLNEYMFEMVNIREQCSWVHQQQKDAATAKAESLVRGAVGKAHLLQPVRLSQVSVTRAAVVVGGGISGMTVALSLARQGFMAHLVEKESELGGNLPHIRHSLEGYDWQAYLDNAIREVTSHQNIEVYVNSEIDEVSGFVGNFRTTLKRGSRIADRGINEEDIPNSESSELRTPSSEFEIEHGVMVVATGGDAWRPDNFMYGEDERILTQWELEDQLESGFSAKSMVMIQCVGSRCDDREYCSRVCCGEAVKNAIAAKEHSPDTDVHILYRDIRTYEFREEYYRKAREKGVKFIRFPDDEYPTIANNGDKLVVNVHDDVIGEKIPLDADLVVLSVATIPRNEENERLAKLLKVPLDKDGFFMEAHVKLRPVEFANAGIFVCGLAHSPKYTEENISQALAVAGRAACVLSQDFLEVGGAVASVDPDKCASCLTCVRECAYDAPFINAEGKAEIEAAKCQGCGNCAAACPAKAIQLSTFTDDQEEALFKSILQEEPELIGVG